MFLRFESLITAVYVFNFVPIPTLRHVRLDGVPPHKMFTGGFALGRRRFGLGASWSASIRFYGVSMLVGDPKLWMSLNYRSSEDFQPHPHPHPHPHHPIGNLHTTLTVSSIFQSDPARPHTSKPHVCCSRPQYVRCSPALEEAWPASAASYRPAKYVIVYVASVLFRHDCYHRWFSVSYRLCTISAVSLGFTSADFASTVMRNLAETSPQISPTQSALRLLHYIFCVVFCHRGSMINT